jgi:hypothetical protein
MNIEILRRYAWFFSARPELFKGWPESGDWFLLLNKDTDKGRDGDDAVFGESRRFFVVGSLWLVHH